MKYQCNHIWVAQSINPGAPATSGSIAVCMLCGLKADMIPAYEPPQEREPPQFRYYPEAALDLHPALSPGYYPKFNEALVHRGITAEQAREASHLLAQLAEYLECIGR